ncbi:Pentapeptide_repeats-containing protein [Hexamita inflata]|uniref:Pentapeptide repeats-containing protein n=1 Tax=Hexamita inflata TaxID=28002 RepID=A0AA86NQH1_9EUKA|nr:Pentapeptide repeats-containing protein [Hexamita inflata]
MDEDIIKQLVKLIEQLKDGLCKQQTDRGQYLDAIVKLEKLQLNCVELEKFENPSDLLIQVMKIAADEMEGLELWKKVKVLSVAYQLILVAYAFNKNKITLTGDSKKRMDVYIQKMRGQIKSSKNSENRLVFYLNVIETGMSALEKDDGTLRSSVFECIKSILKLTCAAVQGNFDDVIKNSLSLMKQLKEGVDSKSKFSWFQQILILNISVGRIDKNISQKVLDYVTQFIKDNINSDWHLAYAGLDIVQKIFENLGTIQQHLNLLDISYILELLGTVQKMKTTNNPDMWHIREKIAEICILNCNHVHIQIQKELSDLIQLMRPEETNNKVRQTLENELITEQVKQCFLNKWNEVQNNEITKFQIILWSPSQL